MSEILNKYGLSPDPDEHPAKDSSETLSKYGLSIDPDEHPASNKRMIGNREMAGWETDPAASKPANPPVKSAFDRVHEAVDPITVVPAVAKEFVRNTGEYASSAGNMISRGFEDVSQGRPASGVGNIGMGALAGLLSPVAGGVKTFVEDPLTKITGNPQFGERAALLFPINTGAPAARTALHNVHPTTKAADEVARIVGPENMPSVLQRLESNSRLRPIDTSDQLRMAGQGLIASPNSPGASKTLTESMRSSAAGARDAVRGTYDEAMGAPPNLFEEYQKLENKARSIGRSKIAPPLIAAGPVDTSGVIKAMDDIIKPGVQALAAGAPKFPSKLQNELQEWRAELHDGNSMLTNADKLHSVQSEMRRRAEELSMNPETRRLGRQLYDYRAKLVDAIDAAAPGYREGLKSYKDQKDIEKAFEFGRDVLQNGKDLKTDPSYLEKWVNHKDRTPEELAAARLGARQAIEQKMGSIKQSALADSHE
jgi:hypothetical protein